jgi:hypothetical protein
MAPFDDALAPERYPFCLTVSSSEPSTLDEHLISVDWGDGSFETFDPAVRERNLVVSHTGSREAQGCVRWWHEARTTC